MVADRLQQVFREIFGDETLTVSDTTSAADVPSWDSLVHINLVYAIENEFGIQIEDERLASFKNVGEMQAYIEERGKGG
jgi:acyl carrier protein